MTRPGAAPAGGLPDLLGGEPVQRRTILRFAASAAMGLTIPAAIPACGRIYAPPVQTYAIDALTGSPPIGDLARVIGERAHALRMLVTLTVDGDLAAQTQVNTTFDPVTNRYPPANALVVVPAVDLAATEATAAVAIRRGAKIVSYPTPMQHQTAAILVDAGQAAELLAAQAAAWAQERLRGRGSVLLVLPPGDMTSLPYSAEASSLEQTLRLALAREAPGLMVGTTSADSGGGIAAVTQGLRAQPATRILLVWDDDTAIAAAQALRQHHAHTSPDGLYVGALGLPAVSSSATFAELQRDDVLRVVIAARARDLANAMVDLPHALLNNREARDIRLALQVLTPHSSSLADYSRDYVSSVPPQTTAGVYEDLGSDATY